MCIYIHICGVDNVLSFVNGMCVVYNAFVFFQWIKFRSQGKLEPNSKGVQTFLFRIFFFSAFLLCCNQVAIVYLNRKSFLSFLSFIDLVLFQGKINTTTLTKLIQVPFGFFFVLILDSLQRFQVLIQTHN